VGGSLNAMLSATQLPARATDTTNGIRAASAVLIADGGSETFDLEEGAFVLVAASANGSLTVSEWVLAIVAEDNTVAHMAASANTATSDSAGDFCVYAAGGDLTFKNNRGANRYVSYWIFGV